MRPIRHAGHKTVLDRIDVDVIDMTRMIGVVADEMLPIAALPYAAFAFFLPAFRTTFTVRQAA